MLQIPAFGILRSDVQQSDARIRAAHDSPCIVAPHICKLEEVFCRAFHIRPAVNQHNTVLPCRENRCKRRPADSFNPANREGCTCQQCTGRAGRNHRIPFPIGKKFQRNRHRRILFPPCRRGRVILHSNDIFSIYNFKLICTGAEAGTHILIPADEDNLHPEFISSFHCSCNDLLRCIITAHGIDDDFHSNRSFLSFFICSIHLRDRAEISAFLLRLPFTR